MTFKLIKTEIEFLVTVVLKNNSSLISIIEQSIVDNGIFSIDIDNVIADVIRDLCLEQLHISGFDENYNLNEEGKILEDLIDIFYIE